MTVLTIGANELRRLLRDRSNLFFVLLLPLLLVLFIGTGMQTGPTIVVSGAGELADSLVTSLRASGAFEEVVELGTDADAAADTVRARDLVAKGVVSAAVIIPSEGDETFGALRADPTRTIDIEIIARDASIGGALADMVRDALTPLTVTLDAARIAGRVTMGSTVELTAAAEAVVPDPDPTGASRVQVTSLGGDTLAAEFQGMGRFVLGATSQLVLFTFLTALVGATSLIQTRELGVAGRIRSTATPLAVLLAGQALGRVSVATFQAVYIVLATSLLFDASWGDPVATAAVVVVFSGAAGGAGMLVGTLARTASQAGAVGIGLGIGLGALGGSMVPLEVMPDALQRVAQVTPHAWANMAFAEIVRRDGGVTDVLFELGVLAGFAVVLLGLAVLALQRKLARG
jgi:ABC-2 type transport system permease protein